MSVDPIPPKSKRVPFWRDLTTRNLMLIIAALALPFAAFAFFRDNQRRVRDAARSAWCRNNLKQIGLALANYEAAFEAYPAGSIPNPGLPPDRRLGWMYTLLPYIDDSGRFEHGRIELAWDDPPLRPLASTSESPYGCPSMTPSKTPGAMRPAVYIGIAGLGLDAPTLPKGHPRAGFFGDDRATTLREITDGTSDTMAVVESRRPAGPWLAGGRHTVRGLDPSSQPYLGLGRQFGGYHPYGANVLMADGSVRFIKDSVDPKVFEAMSTVAGGEKVSAPWEY